MSETLDESHNFYFGSFGWLTFMFQSQADYFFFKIFFYWGVLVRSAHSLWLRSLNIKNDKGGYGGVASLARSQYAATVLTRFALRSALLACSRTLGRRAVGRSVGIAAPLRSLLSHIYLSLNSNSRS